MIDFGDTFITRTWVVFMFMTSNTVFLNFESIAVQLLLYSPKLTVVF